MPNALRRIITLVGAVALLLGVAASLSAPASAVTTDAPIVTPVTPPDGATVAARHVLLTWTSSTTPASYEVRWGTVEELGPDGLIVADGSVTGLTKPRYDIPDLADLTYHWQVRAIAVDGSVGPWSAAVSFVVQAGTGEGEQLDTLAPEGTETADEPSTRTPAASGWSAVDGILYVVVASMFAVILLAAVARTWVRVRHES